MATRPNGLTDAQRRYRAYLASPHWQAVRARILARAGVHCEWCGRFCGRNPHPHQDFCGFNDCLYCVAYFDDIGYPNDLERQTLEVHHLTYERRGAERDEDLAALCWTCHEGVTERAEALRFLHRAGLLSKVASSISAASARFLRIFGKSVGEGDDAL